MAAASDSRADYLPFKTTDGQYIGQQVSAKNFMLCELLDGDVQWGNITCHLYKVSDEGVFGGHPNQFTIKEGELVKRNIIRDRETRYPIVQIAETFSAASFAGKWVAASESTYQVVSFNETRKTGKMDYTYGDFPPGQMHFSLVGNVLVSTRERGVGFYFLQDMGRNITVGLRTNDRGNAAHIVMTVEPLDLSSPAHCAQSYLNYAGYPVGRADGKPGRMSKAGSVKYLADHPEATLEPFTSANAKLWCQHLESTTTVTAKPTSSELIRQ